MARFPAPTPGESLSVKGKAIPFTFWPENYLKYGPLLATDCWQCLSGFVSSSKGIERTVRQRALGYVTQSSDFYLASRETRIGTKPLMLYYSYLNLAKAFLAFRERLPFPSKEGHGLSSERPPKRYRNLSSIKFKVWRQRDHKKRFMIFGELLKECEFPSLEGKKYTISEMMHQIVGLHEAYTATARAPQVLFPARLSFLQDRTRKMVWIKGEMDTRRYTRQQQSKIARFLSSGQFIRVSSDAPLSDKIEFESRSKLQYGKSPINILREKLVVPVRRMIWSEQTATGFRYYMLCSDKKFTAQVASNFAIMFTLGMIVRYTPELIEKMQREWLIHEYLNTQPLQFAYLLGSGIIRNEIIPSSLPA